MLRRAAEPAVGHIAFRVREDADLSALGKAFAGLGCDCRWEEGERGQGPGLRVLDPFGFPLEFFREMDVVEPLTQAFHLQRGAPIMRFDHVNLHVTHVERTLEHWLGPRLPLLGVHLHRGRGRADHRRVGAAQVDGARPRADRRARARACITSAST